MAEAGPPAEWQARTRELVSIAPMMDYTDRSFRQMARIVTKHTRLYTEMVVSGSLWFNRSMIDPSLRFDPVQRPVALQIGGSEPLLLAHAAALGALYGYDEINLNCGCPSERVASAGCFGAALMMEPELVRRGCEAMIEAVRMVGRADSCKVTVKCRLGADHMDSYEEFKAFADAVAAAGVEHLIVHSRKCWLAGLSTKDNRNIPPLRPEWVLRLAAEEGAVGRLRVSINGGIRSLSEAAALLAIRPNAAALSATAGSEDRSAAESSDNEGSPRSKRPAPAAQPDASASAAEVSQPGASAAAAESSQPGGPAAVTAIAQPDASAAAPAGQPPAAPAAAAPDSRRARKRHATSSRLSALAASTATKEYHGPVLWTPADCVARVAPPLPASHPAHGAGSPRPAAAAEGSAGARWAVRPVVPAGLPAPAAFRGGLLDSIMIGRGAYDLWRFADADRSIFGAPNPCPSRAEAVRRYLDTYAVAEEARTVLCCSTVLEGLTRLKAVRTDLIKPIGLLLRGVRGSAKCRQALNDGMQEHRAAVRERIRAVRAEIAALRADIAAAEAEAAEAAAESEELAAMRARFELLGGPGEDRSQRSAKTPLPPQPASLAEAVGLARAHAPAAAPTENEHLRTVLAEVRPFRDMVLEALAAAEPGALEVECPSDPAAPWWDYTEQRAAAAASDAPDRVP